MRLTSEARENVQWLGMVLLALFAQTTIVPRFAILGIQPSVLLAVFFLFAIRCGSLPSLWLGFGCGTLLDVYAPGAAGAFALAMACVGFVGGFFQERTMHTEYTTRVLLLGLCVVLHDGIWFVVSGHARDALGDFLLRTAAPSAIYTMLVGALLFALKPSGTSERSW